MSNWIIEFVSVGMCYRPDRKVDLAIKRQELYTFRKKSIKEIPLAIS